MLRYDSSWARPGPGPRPRYPGPRCARPVRNAVAAVPCGGLGGGGAEDRCVDPNLRAMDPLGTHWEWGGTWWNGFKKTVFFSNEDSLFISVYFPYPWRFMIGSLGGLPQPFSSGTLLLPPWRVPSQVGFSATLPPTVYRTGTALLQQWQVEALAT